MEKKTTHHDHLTHCSRICQSIHNSSFTMISTILQNLSKSPQQIVPLLLFSHVSLSFLSVVNSQLLPSQYEFLWNNTGDDTVEECFDASHYNMVRNFVASMYQGDGFLAESRQGDAKPSLIGSITRYPYVANHSITSTESIEGIQLLPSLTFEDPAVVCQGLEEIREAFRALKAFSPHSLSTPICVNVQPLGESILLTFALHQQYTFPVYGDLTLRSILEVTVELQQRKDIPESDFLVTHIRELWSGKPLAWPYLLYYPFRRLNGFISYQLTSLFL